MFSFPWSRSCAARHAPTRKPRPRFRPAVEILEDRVVPTAVDLFVVPAATPLDNTHFATLQAALSAGSLSGTIGSIIQIEPGSTPGNIAGLTLPSATDLTIQGDPGAGLSATPQFTVSDPGSLDIYSAQTGFIFKGVNIGLIDSGGLIFYANGTITNSNIVDINSSSPNPIIFSDGTAGQTDVLTNSTLTDAGGTASDLLEVGLNGTSTNNRISGNTFVVLGQASSAIFYLGTTSTSVTDDVVDNTFTDPGLAGGRVLLIQVDAPVSNLTIEQNTFSMAIGGSGSTAIWVGSSSGFQVSILDNTINMIGVPSPKGIDVEAGSSGASTVLVENNRIQTGSSSGTGLFFNLNTSSTVYATVQGNDFHDNEDGVHFAGNGAANNIDLGGGGSSIGGNNFRGFSASNPGAIVTDSSTTGTVFAQANIFSVPVPSTATFTLGASIDPSIDSTNLVGNTAFVQTLYLDFLHRAGAASELQGWVGSGLSQAQIANGILRSPESLYHQVDALYLKILGRQADSGNTFFVNLLQNGGTLEQVTVDLATSAEYNALTGSDGAFIQSLYNKIMGRVGDNGGVAYWLSVLPSMGRAGVASAFLSQAEARDDAVEQLYGAPLVPPNSVASMLPDLLHRTSPPAATDVNYWANGGLDLLSLEAALASTGDFFTNG